MDTTAKLNTIGSNYKSTNIPVSNSKSTSTLVTNSKSTYLDIVLKSKLNKLDSQLVQPVDSQLVQPVDSQPIQPVNSQPIQPVNSQPIIPQLVQPIITQPVQTVNLNHNISLSNLPDLNINFNPDILQTGMTITDTTNDPTTDTIITDNVIADDVLLNETNETIQNLIKYESQLNEIFGKMVKTFNCLQLSDYNKQTIISGNNLINTGKQLSNTLKTHLTSINNLLIDCSDFVDEVTNDLSISRPEGNYVYHTCSGMLSYPGRDVLLKTIYDTQISNSELEEKQQIMDTINDLDLTKSNNLDDSNNITPKIIAPNIIDLILNPQQHQQHQQQQPQQALPTNKKQSAKNIECISTKIVPINYMLNVPNVPDVSYIPMALYYAKLPVPGLYMRMPNNVVVQVPFPDIVDSKKEYNRSHSIRCKYADKNDCLVQRQKLAKHHNSTLRSCNFAHTNDKLVKIGYPARCPTNPSFGNPATIQQDINQITESDIKNMLMYGLNDIALACVWLDYFKYSDVTYTNLDKA